MSLCLSRQSKLEEETMKKDRTGYRQDELCDCGVPKGYTDHPVNCFPTFLVQLMRRYPHVGTRDCPLRADDTAHMRRVFMEWTARIIRAVEPDVEQLFARARRSAAERYVRALLVARGLPCEQWTKTVRVATPQPRPPQPVAAVAVPETATARCTKPYLVYSASQATA